MSRRAAEARIALLPGKPCPVSPDDPESISAAVPCVRWQSPKTTGPAIPLRFEGSAGSGRAMTRLALPPARLAGKARRVMTATDARGRRRFVAWAERDAPVIHLLADVRSMADADETQPDPSEAVAEALVGPLLDEILADGAGTPPRVGDAVAGNLAKLVQGNAEGRRKVARRDLEMLERFAREGPLTPDIEEHLRMLRQIAEEPAEERESDPAAVVREVERLRQLVADRAVTVLRVGEKELTGLLSPAPRDPDTHFRPLVFRLEPTVMWGAALRLWDATHERGVGFAPCLGEAVPVLARHCRDRDVDGLVDTVLNFVETNRVGLARRRPRDARAQARARMLDLPF